MARYTVLRKELEAFSPELAARPEVVAINKIDLLDGNPATHPGVKALRAHLKRRGIALHLLSGATNTGVNELVVALWDQVRREKAAPAAATFNPLQP